MESLKVDQEQTTKSTLTGSSEHSVPLEDIQVEYSDFDKLDLS